MTRLSELRALEQAATPGPWRVEGHGMVWAGDYWVTVNPTDADVELIVAWRTAAPAILAVLEAATAWVNDPTDEQPTEAGIALVLAVNDFEQATLESGAS